MTEAGAMSGMVDVDGVEAYRAIPSRPNGHGIVLGMSVWGLVDDLRGWADFLAALGYQVLAPNLYAHTAPGHAWVYDMSRLGNLVPLMESVTDEESMATLQTCAARLRQWGIARCGIVGWCYGGRLACIGATRPIFDAAVAFYPTAFETRLDVLPELSAPLQIHLPERERFATIDDAVRVIADAAGRAPVAECHIYPGTEHGFGFSPPHPHAHPEATRLATARAVLFLDEVLVRRSGVIRTLSEARDHGAPVGRFE